jgi:hypothetical protein
MPRSFDCKALKLKQDDFNARVRGNLTVMIHKNKLDMHILTNMHRPPAEGNFYDRHGKAQKPIIGEDYSWCMGYVDKWGRMANSYPVSKRMLN